MALDSRNKRASAIYVGRWWRNLFPTPTGAAVMSNLYMLGGAYIDDIPSWITVPAGASGSWAAIPAGASGGWTTTGAGATANWTDIVT